jgi:hypothetical protein
VLVLVEFEVEIVRVVPLVADEVSEEVSDEVIEVSEEVGVALDVIVVSEKLVLRVENVEV